MNDPGFLLDTNVISEGRQKRQNRSVAAFLSSVEGRRVCVSVLSIGELRKGAEGKRVRDPRQADLLDDWVDQVETIYREQILQVDLGIATVWGHLSASRPRPIVDTLLAATAIVHNLTLVTRNVADFADTGVALVNPWTYQVE